MIRQLDPENDMADRATFHKQVDANVVHQFLVNSITATGYSNVIQGHEDEMGFTCPATGSIVVDGPSLLHLIWQKVDPSLAVNVETLRAKIESTKLQVMLTQCSRILRTGISASATWMQRANRSCGTR